MPWKHNELVAALEEAGASVTDNTGTASVALPGAELRFVSYATLNGHRCQWQTNSRKMVSNFRMWGEGRFYKSRPDKFLAAAYARQATVNGTMVTVKGYPHLVVVVGKCTTYPMRGTELFALCLSVVKGEIPVGVVADYLTDHNLLEG